MEDEASYFGRRAAEELVAADRADSVASAQIHRSLAARMLTKSGKSPVQDTASVRPPTAPPAADFEPLSQDG